MTYALARSLAFGLAPVQFGLAVTITAPHLDTPESLPLAAGCALAHLVGVVAVARLAGPLRAVGLATAAYLLPLAAAFAVAACHRPRVAEAWHGVVVAAKPDGGRIPPPDRFAAVPPRASPSGDPRLTADRLADWSAAVAAEAALFLARVWAGTPAWAFVLAALVALSPRTEE